MMLLFPTLLLVLFSFCFGSGLIILGSVQDSSGCSQVSLNLCTLDSSRFSTDLFQIGSKTSTTDKVIRG